MKEELLLIIDFELHESQFKKEVLTHCGELIEYYESNKEVIIEKFNEVLNKYNFQTIKKFSPECNEYPQVTLFRFDYSFTFYPLITYESGFDEIDDEIGIIVEEAKIDTHDEKLSDDDNNYIFLKTHHYHHHIVVTFLASIWQEIEGHKSGIVVKIFHDDVCREFFFNDFAWDELSNYLFYNDLSKPLGRYFNKNLSIFELFQRSFNNTFKFNPYINRWRLFSNDNDSFEIVTYGHETGQRTFGASQTKKALKILQHKDVLDALKYVQKQSEIWIENGFREYPTRNLGPIYDGAIESPTKN